MRCGVRGSRRAAGRPSRPRPTVFFSRRRIGSCAAGHSAWIFRTYVRPHTKHAGAIFLLFPQTPQDTLKRQVVVEPTTSRLCKVLAAFFWLDCAMSQNTPPLWPPVHQQPALIKIMRPRSKIALCKLHDDRYQFWMQYLARVPLLVQCTCDGINAGDRGANRNSLCLPVERLLAGP